MSKLALFILLFVAVSAFDPHREGHPRPDLSNTRQPHREYTLPNGHPVRPTMGTLEHHGRKGKLFQGRHPMSLQDNNWPSVKFLPDYAPEPPKIVRNRRQQIHPQRQ